MIVTQSLLGGLWFVMNMHSGNEKKINSLTKLLKTLQKGVCT